MQVLLKMSPVHHSIYWKFNKNTARRAFPLQKGWGVKAVSPQAADIIAQHGALYAVSNSNLFIQHHLSRLTSCLAAVQ